MFSRAAVQLLAFAQLEFTHSVGCPQGCYVVAVPGDPMLRDCLQIETVEAPAAAPRRGRTTPLAEPGARARSVPLAIATLILASRPLADERAAQAELELLTNSAAEQDRLRDLAIAALNKAARAFRASATDPYVTELTSADPRIVRLGYGRSGEIGAGRWQAAFELHESTARHRSASVEELRIYETVAAAMAGQAEIFQAEDLALRALLDLAHDRRLSAGAQARAAVEVLQMEIPSFAVHCLAVSDAREPAAVEAVAREVLETAAAYRQARLRGELD